MLLPHPLRTIQVVNVRWFNATAWYGLELSRLLNAAGHQTTVLALKDTETFEKAKSMGLKPMPMPLNAKNPLALVELLRDMSRLIQDVRPHVVNCHRGESFLFWGLLKTQGHYALIRTRGDQRLPRGNLPNRLLHTRVADAVIATNSVMTRHFATHMGVPPERLHTLLGGVDTNRFQFDPKGRDAVRARYGYTDKHCVLGLLGRFDKVKGQQELILSAARLVREGLPIRLLLIGFPTATAQETVEGWIREAGMERHVRITGKVSDVPACLSALDAGVVASLWSETIARAALEMMACGVPLVATPVGVMPDLLPAEALTPPFSPADDQAVCSAVVDGLTTLLRRVVTDVPWRQDLASINLERISTLRDNDFLTGTLDVYARALRHTALFPKS